MGRMLARHLRMVLGVVALLSAASPVFAAPAVPEAVTNCTAYAGLTARIAGCIRESIDQGAAVFFAELYPYLQGVIAAVLTLAVIVYGIMLAFGAVEKVGRDTYIVLMKLACVVVFCNSSPLIVSTITAAMDTAALAVVSYAPASGTADATGADFSQNECMQVLIEEQAKADPTKPVMAPWLGVDCLVDTVIGIHIVPETAPTYDGAWFNKKLGKDNEGMSRSLIYLFFGAMQSSILGLVLAIIGFFFIYGILMLIVRAFFTYIAGYMGVTFLAIISPLIIPLILFKETKQYFDKWAKMLVSFGLQPIIMLVFIIFSLTALDFAVYSGNYSIYYSIAGKASQEDGFDLNKYLTEKKIINKESASALLVKADNPYSTPKGDEDKGGALNKLLYANCTAAAIAKDPSLKAKCAFTYPIGLARHTIDWKAMEAAHDPAITATAVPGQAISRMVLSSVFFCLMVVFILNGILAVVPMIVGDLLGDLNQSPIIGGFGMGKGTKGSSGGGLGSKLSGAMSNAFKNPFKGKGAIGQ